MPQIILQSGIDFVGKSRRASDDHSPAFSLSDQKHIHQFAPPATPVCAPCSSRATLMSREATQLPQAWRGGDKTALHRLPPLGAGRLLINSGPRRRARGLEKILCGIELSV